MADAMTPKGLAEMRKKLRMLRINGLAIDDVVELLAERDRLAAENERLHKAISDAIYVISKTQENLC
ncbi:MAG: hypothetical protein WBQ34_10215 [Candidatus Acidiferrales bacterium]